MAQLAAVRHRERSAMRDFLAVPLRSACSLRTLARSCAGVFLVTLALTGGAQEIRIDKGKCGEPVHVVARDAALSKVLGRLSDSLEFELVYQSQSDPLVSLDDRRSAVELLPSLAKSQNFSMELFPDPRCVTGQRVSQFSVLPDRTTPTPRAANTPPVARESRPGPPAQTTGEQPAQGVSHLRGLDSVH